MTPFSTGNVIPVVIYGLCFYLHDDTPLTRMTLMLRPCWSIGRFVYDIEGTQASPVETVMFQFEKAIG